ncbi:DAK2 domain-containing protein [Leuconostoc carnosum]|uniref:DAK2 domain-containing protein n=1 Tax=Leuconostoc TaxID=1243 RepID=UPI000D519948|nr:MULTISPECIES: DAK2 domain-containing protein [Leuconostoc]KAA8325531.1 DAK2 domain-containing protein [Leuconostoc carnosum]KAA8359753.1 DAK2 domain-containing protein [Leuconostoc carnosum]KAA8365328.1 DAK2 domain-containing protein [Leuconostoc carnosum]MDV8935726.1 DAK2 domain-containing protein [Leuconostoc sp.]SPO33484.1 putative dihydroxyacetone/glyceraldehyde kinase [Leuconostoc carnosum]
MDKMTTITNVEFGKMINAAAASLAANADKINKLNVFPVPDGDTGTNMSLSMASGAQYERDALDIHIGALAKATSKGLLMGARGNSGVILSQIFRGFSNAVEDKETLNARDLADALMSGAQVAYKSVMKPTEGTILTVIREAAAKANQVADETDDLVELMREINDAAHSALALTPDLLPVLKEVGVVDSGGQGLVFVLQAFYQVLSGDFSEEDIKASDNAELDQMVKELHAGAQANSNLDPNDIEYGYCTEIMVQIGQGTTYDQKFDYDHFYQHLAGLGDSLLVINDDEIVKVHVHTENPGEVLSWGTHFGSLVKVKVDNMRDQQQAVIDEQRTEAVQATKVIPNVTTVVNTAVITIAAGEGVAELFKSLGVHTVISGGQTMNPSTADIVEAINASGAKQVVILPNNSNIFMAADQAVELADVSVKVVKTKTIQQGLTAMMGYNPEADVSINSKDMSAMMTEVKSAQVTKAVRDTNLDGREIKHDDWMGIIDGNIAVVTDKLQTTAIESVEKMLDEDSEIVTIIYGEDAKEKDAKKLEEAILTIDSDLEVEIHNGKQPLYPFLISVE